MQLLYIYNEWDKANNVAKNENNQRTFLEHSMSAKFMYSDCV